MELKGKIKETLREHYGAFKSRLEHEYQDKVTEVLEGSNLSNKQEWVTYNQVILELKHNIKDTLRVKELQYRLTDKEDPVNACIDVIREVKMLSPELERLYHKIMNFS